MKKIIPVNVCIKRFYRAYAEVDENANDEEIRKAIRNAIVENQDNELCDDPDLEIEKDDIVYIDIDHDASWTEEEDEEIKCILSMEE